jgi:hypothetical protein
VRCSVLKKDYAREPSAPARAGGRFAAGAKTSYGNAIADGNTTAAASRPELVNTPKGTREDRDAATTGHAMHGRLDRRAKAHGRKVSRSGSREPAVNARKRKTKPRAVLAGGFERPCAQKL